MITWRLWQALKHPPMTHPLFRRVMTMSVSHKRLRKRHTLLPDFMLASLFIILFALGLMTVAEGLSFIAVVAALVIFGGTIYGLDWSAAISDAVARERESGTFQVLSLIPPGALGASWYIALGQLYRNASFYRRSERFTRVMVMLAALILFLIIGIIGSSRTDFWSETTIGITSLVLFTAVAYVDFIQSILVGVLIGIAVSLLCARRAEAQLWAVTLFLLAQIGSYMLIYVIDFFVLPAIGQALSIDAVRLEILLLLPRLVVFVLIREAVIALLWRWLLLRFNEQTSLLPL